MTTTRKCKTCGIEKPATLEFFAHRAKHKLDLDPHCRACRSLYKNEYRKRAASKNPPPVKESRYDRDLPRVPIERTDMGHGVVRVRFGLGHKTLPAQRPGSSLGYASALSNTMDAPL